MSAQRKLTPLFTTLSIVGSLTILAATPEHAIGTYLVHVSAAAGACDDPESPTCVVEVGEPIAFTRYVHISKESGGAKGEARAHVFWTELDPFGDPDEGLGLHAFASASSSQEGAGGGGEAFAAVTDEIQAFAHASVIPTVTVVGVVALIRGDLVGNSNGNASINATLNSNRAGSPIGSFDGRADGNNFSGLHRRLKILVLPNLIFETGIDIELTLQCLAGAGDAGGSAKADFESTFDIETINFLDAQGNRVDGITVVGESGRQYPVNVPEPSGLAFVLSSAVIAGRHRVRMAAAAA